MTVKEAFQELNEALKELGKYEEMCNRAATWVEEAVHYLNRDVERFSLVVRDNRVCIDGSLWRVCYDDASNMTVEEVYKRFFSDARHLTELLKFIASALRACANDVLIKVEELKKRVKELAHA